MAPSILLIGASGNVGPVVIAELHRQRSSFDRIAILSDPSKLEKFADAKFKDVEIIPGSFTDPNSFKGFDIVISLLGMGAVSQQPAIIDAAVAAGVKHFYPSEIGLDIGVPELQNEKYFQLKLATRRHLDDVVKSQPGFGYTLLIIGMITEFVVWTPIFGVDREKKAVDFIGTADSRITFTSFPDVAKYLVSSLLTTSPGSRRLLVQSETIKAEKLFQTLSKVQNIPYDIKYTSPIAAREVENKFAKDGNDTLAAITSLRIAIGIRGWLDSPIEADGVERVEQTFRRLA